MWQAQNTKVIIKVDEAETQMAGGLYIPESMQARLNTGEIVSVGAGLAEEPMRYVGGEHVMFIPNANSTFNKDGEVYVVIEQNDICCAE
jgi:chaperonin GroES